MLWSLPNTFPDLVSLVSDLITIVTAIILICWFYYSQKQVLSKNYYDEIPGIYAGFTDGTQKPDNYSALIINIREIDNSGYYKGELEFAELRNPLDNEAMIWSIKNFIGKNEFSIKRDKIRHPLKPQENRVYIGKLYTVNRFDFLFTDYKIEDYTEDEYDVIHYRDMGVFVCTHKKSYKDSPSLLPKTFTLHKKGGYFFEPYENIKNSVFKGKVLVVNESESSSK